MAPLEAAFFARPTPLVARELLGQQIVHDAPQAPRRVARIVETEAYLGPEDPGSHATRGQHTQAGVLWGQPGLAYVYICYGIHQMLNVVAHEPGGVGAVLIRAAEPIDGLKAMREQRGDRAPDGLLRGPGKLAEAMGIHRDEHEGVDLTEPGLHLAPGGALEPERVVVTGRIGLSQGGERLLRFADEQSPSVSARSASPS